MYSLLITASFVVSAFAVTSIRQSTPSPSVTVLNSTFIGNLSKGIESFYGVPYAQPPIGSLRLRQAQPVVGYASATIQATATPTAWRRLSYCQRPASCNLNSTARLPVLFYIFGGGFEVGSTQRYDGTGLVETSIAAGSPIVYVAVNYRVAEFGFLGGSEVQAESISNLGLQDQRLGLEWVQDNIAAFVGDPTKVTIMGESAGALSVFSHTIIEGGNNNCSGRPLFRAAIMNSGTIIPADEINSTQAQAIYDHIVTEAGCNSSTNSTLDCLRNLDYDVLRTAMNTIPNYFSYSSLALPFILRPDPTSSFYPVSSELALQAGNYTRVPVITGDEQDEGTLFSESQTNVSTTAELVDYLTMIYPHANVSVLQGLVDGYSNDTAAGSPFGTGSLYYPQFKRIAALLGDSAFTLQRRKYLNTVAATVPSWSFLDLHRFGEALGTYHSSDVEVVFDTTPVVAGTFPIASTIFRSFYVSFVNYLDPNTISTASPLIYWPRYTTWDPVMLKIRDNGSTLIQDDFRLLTSEYLNEHASELRI